MKVIIVGGVAGGASCAARLRRLDEQAEIVMVERGPVRVVRELRAAVPRRRRDRAGVEPPGRERAGRSASSSRSTAGPAARWSASRATDKTVAAAGRRDRRGDHRVATTSSCCRPGAAPIRPPLPGIDLPGIFPVRTVPDAAADPRVDRASGTELPGRDGARTPGSRPRRPARRAVVVGGGFIGLEMAENLVHRGFDVTVVELADQVMAPARPRVRRATSSDFLEHARRARRARRRRRRLRAGRRTSRSRSSRRSPAAATRPTS